MKRIGNLWDKVISMENIVMAHARAKQDKSYYREVRMVDSDPDKYLAEVQRLLITGEYEVSEYRTQTINDKGKERRLMKLRYYPDRIIQWAIMLQLEPVFLKTFCRHTCASIPGRGIKKAYRLVTGYMNKDPKGTKYCAKLDVRKFYDSIDHAILKRLLRRRIKDVRLLELLDKIIDSYPGEKGVPIGSYLSQYFANYYLAYLDHFIKEKLRVKYVVRYMDDIILFAPTKEELHMAVREIANYLAGIKLELKKNWQIFPVWARGVDFVGYRFFHGYILLRKKTVRRIKKAYAKGMAKWNRRNRLSYREWSGIMAYAGWMIWCDSWRLFETYIEPLIPALCEYYWYVIDQGDNRKKKGLRIYSFNHYKARLEAKKGRCAA